VLYFQLFSPPTEVKENGIEFRIDYFDGLELSAANSMGLGIMTMSELVDVNMMRE
jgi:hypothetical protein